ncbi:energy transducer TonB [Sphingomonas sp. CARO-RG-8B-R24-01]|uniref:energy transducer TonB n=1 Tax=Sphingomonas sp. CARO-RG-8B-R24-01 TaxID=2914831 RepID=UPI001F58EF1D|nr:energy transducer TonB [Sphingomonas sp. CARO-RG-8B-R24-01]
MRRNTKYWLALAASTMTLASSSAAAQTPQMLFNTAQAAFDTGDFAAAIVNYRAALAVLPSTAHSAAVIHARLAYALRETRAFDAAIAEATLAVRAFGTQKVTRDDDLSYAFLLLGSLHRGGETNAQAIPELQSAIAAETDLSSANALSARYTLALAALTEQPDLAARTLDAIRADVPRFGKLPKTDQANVLSTRALAELNRGQPKLAVPFIEQALDLTGRTSTRVSISEVRIRGNAALIYARLGNEEKVRQYLAYSGAGHLPDQSWLTVSDKDLPVCGDDVTPQDVAVVEFAIADDGRVTGTTPVFASRPGPLGNVFAASVNAWRWQPAALAKLDAFWRQSVRLELRCVKRPPLLSLEDAFRDRTRDWLTQNGVDPDAVDSTFDPDRHGGGAIPKGLFAVRSARDNHSRAEALAALDTLLVARNAPADVRAFALYVGSQSVNAASRRGWQNDKARLLGTALARLDDQPGAERARAWLRTEQALAFEAGGTFAPLQALLQAAIATPPALLPQDDPIRSLAQLHLALLDRRKGAPARADARLTDAGITPEQCSLLDVRPVPQNTSISSDAFPSEALRWGFEGNARTAFDIAPDGSVTDVRTVIAYPPFVFGPSTEKAVARFRYLPPTLGSEVLGCVGQSINVVYRPPK